MFEACLLMPDAIAAETGLDAMAIASIAVQPASATRLKR
jgi:hypothetical protein